MEDIKKVKRKTEALIIFPAWETILNHAETQFSSYFFKKWLGENLYLCIEHKPNTHADEEHNCDLIEISYCNRAGFAIASESLPFSKDGYNAAIAQLICWAETFQSIFSDVATKSLVRKEPQ